jgi:hypothetical protein
MGMFIRAEAGGCNVGYIDENLVAGEQVVFRTKLHWYVIIRAIFGLLLLGFIAYVTAQLFSGGARSGTGSTFSGPGNLVLLCLVPLGLLGLAGSIMAYSSAEFGVTNRRVLIKTGVIRRQTLELSLSKIESFRTHESLIGQLLGFKTITLTGSGGTNQRFAYVDRAHEFRQAATQMGTQLNEQGGPSGYYGAPPAAPVPPTSPARSRSLLDEVDLPDEATQQGIQRAVAHIRAGETEQAKALVQQLTRSAPNNADVWYLAGYLMTDRERKRAAYNRALALDPAHRKAREGLAALG